MNKKVVVLVSGGMDSVTALYDAIIEKEQQIVGMVSFHYGSKHNQREIPFAAWHARELRVEHIVIELPFVGQLFASSLLQSGGEIPKGHYEEESMKQTVVPFRNGIMLSIAAGLAESRDADALVIAAHAGDHAIYPDCREGFMYAMHNAIRLGTYRKIELLRPFIAMSKAEICKHGFMLGVDFENTWSCYIGREIHCGECGTCVERREAFIVAGIPDPTIYNRTGPLPSKPGNTVLQEDVK